MILSIEGLNSFYGKSHILHGVNLNLEKGEVSCLLGRNGVGKSTTLMSIMGLVEPASGSITFKGEELAGKSTHNIAKAGVGYVPEERRIFKSLTVEENLRIGIKKNRALELEPWTVERVFDSFTRLGERKNNKGGHLSGGEQQMLTIARTLMGNPELLLVDEPSEGLAPLVAQSVMDMLSEISHSGVTILLVEQNYKAAVKIGKNFFIMAKGEVVFNGDAAALENAEEERKTYLEV